MTGTARQAIARLITTEPAHRRRAKAIDLLVEAAQAARDAYSTTIAALDGEPDAYKEASDNLDEAVYYLGALADQVAAIDLAPPTGGFTHDADLRIAAINVVDTYDRLGHATDKTAAKRGAEHSEAIHRLQRLARGGA